MSAPDLLPVFVGWDSKESVAFHVLAHSILKRATRPIALIPLTLSSVARHYTRPRGETESTEFSLTRFLVPFLCGFQGFAIFMDCDMLCRCDLSDVWLYPLSNPGKAVYCCQHDYTPRRATKFLGHVQTAYPRKNWSSFMVFDNARCAALTPEYVNTASGLDLHRFHWLRTPGMEDELGQVGAIPVTWNWLVGEYPENASAQILHYTNGTPCFPGLTEQSELWWSEFTEMASPVKV